MSATDCDQGAHGTVRSRRIIVKDHRQRQAYRHAVDRLVRFPYHNVPDEHDPDSHVLHSTDDGDAERTYNQLPSGSQAVSGAHRLRTVNVPEPFHQLFPLLRHGSEVSKAAVRALALVGAGSPRDALRP